MENQLGPGKCPNITIYNFPNFSHSVFHQFIVKIIHNFQQVSIPKCETYEYLIGKSIEKFETNPIKEIDILRLYAGYNKMAESEKFKKILREINEHCEQQNIRMKNNEAIRIKIKRLVSAYKVLLGKRKVRSTKERQRQENFVQNIHKCFNVVVDSPEQMNHETSNRSVEKFLL